MRQALIYNQDQLAGLLTEDENGYTFQYDTAYIKSSDRMSLLLACCKDCIGAVSVIPILNKE